MSTENDNSENMQNSKPKIVDNAESGAKDNTDEKVNEDKKIKKLNDFPSMFLGCLKAIPFKLGICTFILLLITLSKQFIENVMLSIGGNMWVDGDQTTSVGTIVLALFQSIGVMVLHLLIKSEVM